MAAACCLLIAALFESCIQCGLILVNNRYGELFQASRGINAQISDRNLNIRYTTGDGIELDKEEMKEALENPGNEKEGIRLNSIPINGGYAFWIEDIRQHRAAYESLYELREELRDRNQLLKLEYQKEKELIIFIKDSHELNSVEHNRFGTIKHCINGTTEAELIDEFKKYEIYEKGN